MLFIIRIVNKTYFTDLIKTDLTLSTFLLNVVQHEEVVMRKFYTEFCCLVRRPRKGSKKKYE